MALSDKTLSANHTSKGITELTNHNDNALFDTEQLSVKLNNEGRTQTNLPLDIFEIVQSCCLHIAITLSQL